MGNNRKIECSPQKHEVNNEISNRTETNCPQRITIGNEVEEDYSSVKFCLETEQIVQLLENIVKDLIHHEITFSEADWYLKGVLGVARLVKGPARLVLTRRLKGLAEAFSKVEKAEYTAISQLDEFISEPTEREMEKEI